MAGVKTPSSTWCILRNDYKLREVLKYQMEKHKWNKETAAKNLGVSYPRVYNYFAGRKGGLTQFQVVQLCDLLGLDVSLDIRIRPDGKP